MPSRPRAEPCRRVAKCFAAILAPVPCALPPVSGRQPALEHFTRPAEISPLFGSPLYTYLATDVAIWALFAISLNLLVGYTGLVSFGHAAYFGIGAYTCGLLMKEAGVAFLLAFLAGGVVAALFAAVYGYEWYARQGPAGPIDELL